MKQSFVPRPLKTDDVAEYADLLYSSFNTWYWKHGWRKNYFECSPQETSIFYEIYNDLTPDCSIAAFDDKTGRMMGSCFYHPREHHVSLGIMSVHPNYSGRGVGRQLVNYILDYTKNNGYKSCRLVSSAINMDSFSLYNRAGFIPRVTYHDTVINVPEEGHGGVSVKGENLQGQFYIYASSPDPRAREFKFIADHAATKTMLKGATYESRSNS